MEKRQLDLNKPLLSVRRIPKLGYRSAMSGEIVQRPPPAERRLPPPPSHYSENHTEQVTKPAAVPFVWEHVPGRSKSGPLYLAQDEPQAAVAAVSPRFPPGRALAQGQKEFDEMYVRKAQTRAPSPIIRASTMFERSDEKEGGLRSDENDEFADALDTLLPEETSMNCSVSGLSGEEGPKSAADQQTHDFLMSRFLPAAKAMALESPQYAVKKLPAPAPVEEPKQPKRLSNAERTPRPQLKQYASTIAPHSETESESDDESHNAPGGVSVRACGFLPRFCLKNSLAIINHVTTDVRGRSPSPSPRVPRGEGRKVPKSPSSRPRTPAPSPIPDKQAWEASHRRILERKAEQQKLAEASIDKQIDEYLKSNAAREASRVSPHRNSVRGNISPYRNQRPPSPFREGAGFLGIPKDAEKPKARDSVSSSGDFHDALPPAEKTVYIDFVNHVKKSDSGSERDFTEAIDSARKKTIGPESIPHVMRRLKELSLSKRDSVDSFASGRPSLSGISRHKAATDPRLDRKPVSFVKVTAEDLKKESTKDDSEPNPALVASPLPPPLPKLPSESWLWRTLPSIPSKNPFSGLKRSSSSKPPSPTPKWETIVKSSKLHNDHKRYSEELSADVLRHYRK
uniref:Uncharacterized protein n=1 Tax=Kalanchoe fedtschenkoi TaxID=63787 RepID=A0A7N0UI83_KALFE